MAEFVKQTETGQIFWKDPAGEWKPVSEEAAQQIQRGQNELGTGVGVGVTEGLAGAVEGLGDILPGGAVIGDALDRFGVPENAPIRAILNPFQAAARGVREQMADPAAREAAKLTDPGSYYGGQALTLGAELAAGPAAGRAAGRAALSAAERVALGTHEAGVRARLGRAAREAEAMPAPGGQRVAGENPNVFADEARFADALDDVRGAPGSVRGAQPAEMEEAARQGLGARLFKWGEPDPPDPKVIKTAERLGFKLSPADRSGRVAQKNFESNLQSNPAGMVAFERDLMRPNRQRMNQLYADAIGLPRNKAGELPEAITPEVMGQAVDAVQDTFRKAAGEVGDVQLTGDWFTKAFKAVDGLTDLPDAKRDLERVLNDLPSNIRGRDLFEKISRLRADAAGARDAAGRASYSEGLEEIADRLEERLLAPLKGSTRKAVQEARERWRMIRLGEKGRAVDEAGDVSLNGLANNARNSRFTREAYRRGRGMKTKAAQDLFDGLRTMQHFRERIGNSGTATRAADFMDPRTYAKGTLAEVYLGNYGRGALRAGQGVGAAGVAGAGASGVYGGILGD